MIRSNVDVLLIPIKAGLGHPGAGFEGLHNCIDTPTERDCTHLGTDGHLCISIALEVFILRLAPAGVQLTFFRTRKSSIDKLR